MNNLIYRKIKYIKKKSFYNFHRVILTIKFNKRQPLFKFIFKFWICYKLSNLIPYFPLNFSKFKINNHGHNLPNPERTTKF